MGEFRLKGYMNNSMIIKSETGELNKRDSTYKSTQWYVLWGPLGLKTQILSIGRLLKKLNPDWGLWFPVYTLQNSTRALFPCYTFIKCRWDYGLEDLLKEHIPIPVQFLSDSDNKYPSIIQEETLESTLETIEEIEKGDIVLDIDFKVGDKVFISKKSYGMVSHGIVLNIRRDGKVEVKCFIFNREVVLVVERKHVRKYEN